MSIQKYTKDQQELLVRILEEDMHNDRDFWDGLSLHERQWVLDALDNENTHLKFNALWEYDWLRLPPTIDEALDANYENEFGEETNYYFGPNRALIYPYWEKELRIVLSEDSEISEWVETGPIGGGKTYAAVHAQIFKLVRLSCLRNPHRYYKLDSGVPIVFSLFNVTMHRADLSAFTQLKSIVNTAQYFRDNFPVDRRRVINDAADDDFKYAIKLPNNIKFILGSDPDSAISANVIGGILDEINYKETKSHKNTEGYTGSIAFQLYANVQKRITSRFEKEGRKRPGILCNVSSRKSTMDFLEEHIKKLELNDQVCRCDSVPHTCGGKPARITADAIYRMKPADQFSKETFRVMIGTQFIDPKILQPGEAPHEECYVEDVPINFLPEFERDIDGSIRDICGIATYSDQPYLRNREALWACVNQSRLNPFPDSVELWTDVIKDGEGNVIDYKGPTLEDYLIKERLVKHAGGGYIPRYHSHAERFVHMDLSITGDCTGLAMGCISRNDRVKRRNKDGSYSESIGPVVWFDFLCRIVPKQGKQIDYEKIRQFILTLRNIYNFPIKRVSTDQFQSTYIRQLLEKEGFETAKISMDTPKDDNPLVARMAITEGRIDMPRFEPLIDEILHLYHNIDERKVDHRANKSKDVFDAFGGVICSISLEAVTDTMIEVSKNKPEVIMSTSNRPRTNFVNDSQVFGDLISRVSDD